MSRARRARRSATSFVILSLLAVPAAAADRPIDLDSDIRPILSENCFHCHGPDAAGRQADLRLDTREGALANGVVVPGQRGESELMRRLLADDPDEQMPPPSSNRRVTAAQRELLARWIDAGAPWSEHWAFVRPSRPAVPSVDPAGHGALGAIDAFIRNRLHREGLAPSAEADRGRLLRRVTLDLTGVPPTVDELDTFLSDSRPDAYERVVDRLLASPRYGERMVWEWLDAARFADTNGYQGDPTRAMWYWRDWAIAAFNANQPFDRFTVEQLAGDLLPSPTRDQLIATGFHRNHMINGEGGRIAEESRIDYVQDRVETTATVWLGLTFNCCRCHDHKYDPLSQKDYYRLAAYFNSIDETGRNDDRGLANPLISVATDAQQAELEKRREAEGHEAAQLKAAEDTAMQEFTAWEAATAEILKGTSTPVVWTPIVPTSLASQRGAKLTAQPDGSVLVTGENPAQEVYTLAVAAPTAAITALQLEALPDESLPGKGPGRAGNGNFVLTELTADVQGASVTLKALSADFTQDGFPAPGVTDGNQATGWAVQPQFGQPHRLTAAVVSPVSFTESQPLTVRLAFLSSHDQHTLGRFRLSWTSAPIETIHELPPAVAAALPKTPTERTPEDQRALREHYLSQKDDVRAARQRADRARTQRESFERSMPRTMVLRDRPQPRETFVLVRGAYDKPSDAVTHGTPGVLPPLLAGAAANRLALAEWIVATENPLTARVIVNRIWQSLLGIGLVKTVDDFGSQGEKPVHPELLDWLACEFTESGWDVKHLHRLIVTSATYRQSSVVTPMAWERDPDNRLLARGPRYRWPSWMLRDQALAVSGLLDEHVGGPSVKGYQPSGIWEEATFGQIGYVQDHGTALYRRSLYQFWRRIVGPTVFFDVSSRQNCAVKVDRTNTPLHALVLLNDVTYVEAARVLAANVLREAGTSTEARLTSLYRRCLSRPPTSAELARLVPRVAIWQQQFEQHPDSARQLGTAGEFPADGSLPSAELATWTTMALLVLNLDEALSKE